MDTAEFIPPDVARAVIHLENLKHNLSLIREHVGPGVRICMPVKANAYGHGLVPVARAAEALGVEALSVAFLSEAAELRRGGIRLPILLMSPPVAEEIPGTVALDVEPFAGSREVVEALEQEARRQNRPAGVHLKVDTGMTRNGCSPGEAAELGGFIQNSPFLRLAGLCTHFAGSDMEDTAYFRRQADRFLRVRQDLESRGIRPGLVHAANSGAVVAHREVHFDMVRPGILVYGYYPSREQQRTLPVRPLMSLETRVVGLRKSGAGTPVSYGMTHVLEKESWIATLRIGYGDGLRRNLSGRIRTVIRGRSYPLVGRICMDHVMADLGPETEVKTGDQAVIFGPGEGCPTAEDLADLLGTISYEILTGISPRVGRQYTRL